MHDHIASSLSEYSLCNIYMYCLFSAVLIIDDDQLPKDKDLELAFHVWQVCSIIQDK